MNGLRGVGPLTVGSIAVLVSLLSAEGKRVGDYLAGTVVVRERAPARDAFHPALDPSLAPWAATLDLGRLDEATAMAVRQFLVRAAGLGPGPRRDLAASLSAEVQQKVSPPPPPGVTSEAYLNAVLAERRRRADATDAPPTALPEPPGGKAQPPPSDSGGFAAPS